MFSCMFKGSKLTIIAYISPEEKRKRERERELICKNPAQKKHCSLNELRLMIHLAIIGIVLSSNRCFAMSKII